MGDFVDCLVCKLFQGQRTKTVLVRVFVHCLRNVLLDELTNGLDVMAVRSLRALLVQLRNEGHCVLFSSHVMQEVATLCDDVIVISQGVVVAAGSTEEIRTRAGQGSLEEAFVQLIGTGEGLA